MSDPAELITGLARYTGGLAEVTGDGKVLVLLPPEEARRTGFDEALEFAAGPLAGESDLVERMAPLLGEGGRREVWWPGELYLKREGVAELAAREIAALNGLFRASRSYSTYLAYDAFTFRYTAASEETEEGLVTVSANTVTGAAVPGLAEALSSVSRCEEEAPAVATPAVERALNSASAEAKSVIRGRLAPFVKSLERRLRRDERRLAGYYGALADQVDRRRSKVSREDRREKRAAIARELDRKLRDLDSRYAVRVEMEAVSVSRAVLPAVLVPLVAVRRKSERTYPAVWNPVLKAVEPLACEGCRRPARSFQLCDAHAHVFCIDCAASADLRRSCPRRS